MYKETKRLVEVSSALSKFFREHNNGSGAIRLSFNNHFTADACAERFLELDAALAPFIDTDNEGA